MTAMILAAAVALAAPADPTIKEVEDALQVLNDAFKTGDANAIRTMMTDDHVAVTPWAGMQKREEQIKTLPDLKLTTYETGKMTFTFLGPDSAIISYKLTMAGTYKGKAVPKANYASAVWVRRGGKWKELHYQETPLEGK